MSLLGAYADDGVVVLEDDVHGETRLTWRQAMERCAAVAEAEQRDSYKNRSKKIQRILEEMVAAAVSARKFAQPGWEPPPSVLGFSPGKKASRIVVPGRD